MNGEYGLIVTLAIILIAAGVFTIISKALKQPLILGYIIAGFLVSPHLGLLPKAISVESVEQWSEIGIIFLLYGLGLEFSFKKLLKVGSASLITAVTKCIGMFIVGMITGKALGWSTMESVFLGGLISMSSTTIIIKAYDDLGLKKEPYAPLVFGSLVVEDLIAVLLMVLFSTLASAETSSGLPILKSMLQLFFFVTLWFLIGIFLIPTILKKVKRWLNDEILLIFSIGLCFAMVGISAATGFSAALGAFVMGSILSETVEGPKIEQLTVSIKDMFGAIFFVSVGMMINPAVIAEHWGSILTLVVVSLIGILFFSSSGALIAGRGLDTAVHAGFSMAQLGEFAFILAGLGCSLGVMRDFIYPVIIAVSVITTFTTPYMIKAATPTSRWLHKKLPASFIAKVSPSAESVTSSKMEDNDWKLLIKNYLIRIILYGVILVAILMISNRFLDDIAAKLLPDISKQIRDIVCTGVTLLMVVPFIYGLAVKSGSITGPAQRLLKKKASNRWPIISLIILRSLLGVMFVLTTIFIRHEMSWGTIVCITVIGICVVLRSRHSVRHFSSLEDSFMANLNEREIDEMRKAPVSASVKKIMAGYDVHLEVMEISPYFTYLGKPLREMPFRHNSGVSILKIQRGDSSILIPSGGEQIFPYDKLLAVGTTGQLAEFKKIMDGCIAEKHDSPHNFDVQHFTVKESDMFCEHTLRMLKIRDYGCMVLSVLRGEEFITNPKADFKFVQDDIVWIAGTTEAIKYLI